MLEPQTVNCPYCGARFDTVVDLSAGAQRYIEDCRVCCRPIEFVLNVNPAGDFFTLDARRDDD